MREALRTANKSQGVANQLMGLNVVFDRTCVDDTQWSKALILAMDYEAVAQSTAEFNKEIRSAVISGLQESFREEAPLMSIWCVNDVHDAFFDVVACLFEKRLSSWSLPSKKG